MALTVRTARSDLREGVVEAVVIRADGTREDLGAIAYWHANPLRRWWGQFRIARREWRRQSPRRTS